MMQILVFLLFTTILVLLTTPVVEMVLVRANMTRSNYRGMDIPFGSGIHLPLLVTVLAYFTIDRSNFSIIAILAWGFMFLGIIDDFYGDRSVGGFRGHFKRLFTEHVLTTGAFKAMAGGALSLWAATMISPKPVDIIINTILIGLSANYCNLLDVRPGRAVKGFLLLLFSFMILVLLWPSESPVLTISFLMGLTGLSMIMFFDLRESSMLGDTGSGVLGVLIGFVAALGLGLAGRVILTCALVAFHIFTEKRSVSALIESNRMLRIIDRLGRKSYA